MLVGNPAVQVWESTLVIVGISDSTGTCNYWLVPRERLGNEGFKIFVGKKINRIKRWSMYVMCVQVKV